MAEIEVRSGTLDDRNMVCDFSDIKRIVKGWVDRELDHKMILREDDPLVAPMQRLGEPVFVVKSNPTVEHIAKLLYDYTHSQGFPVVRVTVWETPTSFATYGGDARLTERDDANGSSSPSSISTARSSIRGATWPTAPTRCSPATAPRRSTKQSIASMVGSGAATLVKRVITAAGVNAPPDEALARFLSAYDLPPHPSHASRIRASRGCSTSCTSGRFPWRCSPISLCSSP